MVGFQHNETSWQDWQVEVSFKLVWSTSLLYTNFQSPYRTSQSASTVAKVRYFKVISRFSTSTQHAGLQVALLSTTARRALGATRGMAGGRAAFNWKDPLMLEGQLTDEEAMIQVRLDGLSKGR